MFTVTRSSTGTATHLGRKNASYAQCGTKAPRVLTTKETYAEAYAYAVDKKNNVLCKKCFAHKPQGI